MVTPRILVVEDEAIVARDLENKLQDMGYRVVGIASSGEQAVGDTEKTLPDLVLMDIVLKGKMNGLEAAQEICTRFDIPVVYVTAYADEALLQRAKITEPYGYIIKPLRDRELRTAIEIALYRYRMERKLKDNQQWLDTILKSIGDAVIATDSRGSITFMNPAAEILTGWRQEEGLGRKVDEIINLFDEETRTVIEDPATTVLSDRPEMPLRNYSLLIVRDGSEKPVMVCATPIRNQKGQDTGVVVVFKDITKRKSAERELARYRDRLEELVKERTSELAEANRQLALEMEERKRAEEERLQSAEKYRQLFETLIDVYYRVDSEGTILMVSPSITQAAGYKPEEVIGSNIKDFYVEPREREQFLEDIVKRGHVEHFEVQMKRKDGSILWASVNARLVRHESGNVVGIEGIARDISEHKRAQEEILRTKEEWERTFDSVSDLIAIIDRRHRIVRLNKAMADRLGMQREEVTGLTCYEHVHGVTSPPDDCPHSRVLVDRRTHSVEIYEDRLRGHFLVTVSPLFDNQGRLIGSVHVAHDISERKRAEADLHRAHAKLEERVKERTLELTAKTQHLEEVNTALKVLLKQRAEDRGEFEEAIMDNVRNLILPYIEKLKRSRLDHNQETYLAILESHINDITSTFVRKLSLQHMNLTPSEMQVAILVREGKTTKEIARILCVSEKATSFHRNNIRRKLGLNKSKTNLRSYLTSLL